MAPIVIAVLFARRFDGMVLNHYGVKLCLILTLGGLVLAAVTTGRVVFAVRYAIYEWHWRVGGTMSDDWMMWTFGLVLLVPLGLGYIRLKLRA